MTREVLTGPVASPPRLNLGCGTDIRPEYINMDVRDLPGVDIVGDARNLMLFDDGTLEEILAFDLFEHIPPAGVPQALKEWRRVLKVGGLLKLRIPDLKKIGRKLVAGTLDDKTAMFLIYGDQSPEAGGTAWGSHKAGYTGEMLTELFQQYDLWIRVVFGPADEHNLYAEFIVGQPQENPDRLPKDPTFTFRELI